MRTLYRPPEKYFFFTGTAANGCLADSRLGIRSDDQIEGFRRITEACCRLQSGKKYNSGMDRPPDLNEKEIWDCGMLPAVLAGTFPSRPMPLCSGWLGL